MNNKKDRRSFLRGAGLLGASSLALPLLPSLAPRRAYGAAGLFPKRLVVFFSGNGTIYDNWKPKSEAGKITELSPILMPLKEHLQDLTVIDGMEIAAGDGKHQPGSGFHGHERGLGAILTGTHLNLGKMEANSWYANGISVDQFLANKIADSNALHSLQVGIISPRHGSGWYNRDTMTYAGPNDPRFAESDGSKLFARIFGDTDKGQAEFAAAQARRKSVLDFLKDDLRRVKSKISSADRQRLAQHEDTFVSLEKQLSKPAANCNSDMKPGISNWMDQGKIADIAEFQMQQTVQALACDRTRVATIQFGKGLGALNLGMVGSTESWHGQSHEGDHNQVAKTLLTDLNKYIAQRFSNLLTMMKAITEGNGTMLDNSVVLWVNELGRGNNHTYTNAPVVMAGGLAGTFRAGGRHVKYNRRPNNDLLITLCQAFGQDVNTFGKEGLTTGPMTELLT